MDKANSLDLDLVEIVPNSKPPVCKIMDYGKNICWIILGENKLGWMKFLYFFMLHKAVAAASPNLIDGEKK